VRRRRSRARRFVRLRAATTGRLTRLRTRPVRRVQTAATLHGRGIRRGPVVRVRVRRARSADWRLEEPAGEPSRGRGARLVQPYRPGRHQAHRGLHRGPAQRIQRGRHQGADRSRD